MDSSRQTGDPLHQEEPAGSLYGVARHNYMHGLERGSLSFPRGADICSLQVWYHRAGQVSC